MKQFIFILLIFLSCSCNNWIKSKDLMKVKPGMHMDEIGKILKTPMDIDEVRSDEFLVGKNYFSESGYKNTVWMYFKRSDSTLIYMW